jgi:hypothetical protein
MSDTVVSFPTRVHTNNMREVSGDTAQGAGRGVLSTNWWGRDPDSAFTSLPSMLKAMQDLREGASEVLVSPEDLRFSNVMDDPDDTRSLYVGYQGKDNQTGQDVQKITELTNFAFGQLCGLSNPTAPQSYLKEFPALHVATMLRTGILMRRDSKLVKVLTGPSGTNISRAFTGAQYGRIWNSEVILPVMNAIEGDGVTGRWRVPVNMHVDYSRNFAPVNIENAITQQNTTLFANDRGCYMFLVDTENPIEIGRAPNGDPDVVYRGLVVENSEVGAGSLVVRNFLFRSYCQNRCIFGVGQWKEIRVRHARFAPDRWERELAPRIAAYAKTNSQPLIESIAVAQDTKLGHDDDAVKKELSKMSKLFTETRINQMLKAHLAEEHKPLRTVWDAANGITAVARELSNTDTRMELEAEAGKILARVA